MVSVAPFLVNGSDDESDDSYPFGIDDDDDDFSPLGCVDGNSNNENDNPPDDLTDRS